MPSAEKITELTAYAAPLSTDVVPVVDLTGPTTKKATIAALIGAAAPKTHAASHAAGGSDPVTLTEAQITGLVADLAAKASLTDLALKAPLASPALTGSPTAPTQAGGDSSTKLATTAFVAALATTTSAAGAVPKAGANGNLAPGWLRRKLATNTDTGAQNDWAPGIDGDTFLPWAGLADLTVTGFAGGVAGDIFIFKNTGTKNAFFTNQSGSSAAGNKLTNIVTSGQTPVSIGGFGAWAHDGSNWLLIGHEQGEFITAAYNAANFTADAGTWTVDSGDITTMRYKVDGARIYIEWVFFTTSTSTTPTFLKIGNGAYGGYTSAAQQVLQTSVIYSDAGGSLAVGFAETGVQVSTTQIFIAKTGGLGWGVNTNTLYVYGGLSFDIN